MDRKQPPSHVSRSVMHRLGAFALAAAVVIACIVAAGVTFIMVAAPIDFVREEIVAQVKARTGRTLVLAGPATFNLVPSASFSLADVSLSAPPGMDAAPLMTIKRLSVEVQLMPLLRRQVVVDRITLSQPVFELVVDGAGRRSWDFAASDAPPRMQRVRLAQAGQSVVKRDSPAQDLGGGGLGGLEAVIVADARIESGVLRFSDLRTGMRTQAHAINADIGLQPAPAPLTGKGSFIWQGETLHFDARLQSLHAVLEGQGTRLMASVKGRPLEASYDGLLTHRGGVALEGNIAARSESLRRLGQWLGSDLPSAQGFGAATLAGHLRSGGQRVSLESAVATLNGSTTSGSIALDSSAARPHVTANLRISELDLSMYRDARGSSGLPPQAGPAAPPAGERRPQTIEDLLRREGAPGPKVQGFLQREGWSGEPLSLAALSLADADATLIIDKLAYGDIRTASNHIVVALKAGALRLTVQDAQLYEGRAKGFITLEGDRTARLGASLLIEGVSAHPLFKDAAGFDGLAGKAGLSLALAGQGHSEREIVGSLLGQANFRLVDGAIVGWNLPQIVRGIGQGRFAGFERDTRERTEFSELAASFQIASGIATNKDLRLTSPLLRATGAGTVELAQRRIDYTLRPKLIVSLTGQAAATDQAGFEIPIKIQGPWDNPSFTPDLQSVLREPDQVIEAVKQLGKQLDAQGGIGEVLRRALGGGKN